MMQSEGHDAIWQRHLENRDQTRAGVARLGLSPVVAEAALASHAVTSIYPPQGLAVADIRAALKSRYGILVADGQKELKGKIFRIGHLGYISPDNVARVLAALKEILETS
jgi:aspartate aminotransferase-like enzyme